MKTTKILSIALLTALLAAGCGKDNGRIKILAEPMNRGAKIMIPAEYNNATWVVGENINLNGSSCAVCSDGGSYYLEVESSAVAMNAVYPAALASGGNDLDVAYGGASGNRVVLRRLAVNFVSGGHQVMFPMTAHAASGSSTLRFNHLTAGFRLTLTDTSATGVTLGYVKVVTQTDAAVRPLGIDGDTAVWAVQGPSLPSGEVGDINDDPQMKYCSEMNFAMQTDGVAGVALAARGGSRTFCVPVTVSSVKKLVVTGYDLQGRQLFVKSKTLAPVDVQRNRMYDIPTVEF